jgi:serine protease AprX
VSAGAGDEGQSVVEGGLLEAAKANQDGLFNVIVQGDFARSASTFSTTKSDPGPVGHNFVTVDGTAVTLTGSQLLALAQGPSPLIITPDDPVAPAGVPANLEAPAVTGSAEGGETLKASEGTWAAERLKFGFQWQRCGANGRGCSAVDGEDGRHYRLGFADLGSTLRVVVTARGVDGTARARSLPSDVIAVPESNHGRPKKMKAPRIGGRAKFANRLTAAAGAWTAGGTPSFDYQWQRCAADRRTDAVLGGEPEAHWTAAPTRDNDPDAAPDALSSSFTFEAWVTDDGMRGDRRYLVEGWLAQTDVATRWAPGQLAEVSLFLDSKGHYGLVVGGTDPVTIRTNARPRAGILDHVAGTWDGSTLTLVRNGQELGSRELQGPLGELGSGLEFNGEVVEEAAVYPRALPDWELHGHEVGCVDIQGASAPTYEPTVDDVGSRLRVAVTGTSTAASAADASGLTPDVIVDPPSELSSPTVIGTAEEGQTLSAAHGAWDGSIGLEFSYQWQSCRDAVCTDLPDTAATYRLAAADVGSSIRVAVTARGPEGEATAVSEETEVVTAIPELFPEFKLQWPYAAGVAPLAALTAAADERPPTIAIVDSGVDTTRPEFAGRVVEQVSYATRNPNSPGDGYGHGTAVAGIAAGTDAGYTGAAPKADIVSIDVLDDTGVANTSDVIAAADWIYRNRERLNIRIANFSLHGTSLASLVSDPLDKAVERLWLSGIVVVAAAGNYAVAGQESAVPFAPANDPFVLTVGATDTMGTYTVRDDTVASWSAWGYTRDGFAKPELGAPGRFLAAPVPPDAKLTRDRPDRVVSPGYLQLSGTSLAAPIVAGAAADLLALHPEWTPDQVKGALMLRAQPLRHSTDRSIGVGTVDAAAAAGETEPPNPNLALRQFVVPDPNGGATPVFDSSSWTTAVTNDPAWASVAWGSVAWGSAAWSSVAWGSVAWGSVAWGSIAYGSVAWGSVAWGSVAWGSGATDDVRAEGPYTTSED